MRDAELIVITQLSLQSVRRERASIKEKLREHKGRTKCVNERISLVRELGQSYIDEAAYLQKLLDLGANE